jgi:hypothetical protein
LILARDSFPPAIVGSGPVILSCLYKKKVVCLLELTQNDQGEAVIQASPLFIILNSTIMTGVELLAQAAVAKANVIEIRKHLRLSWWLPLCVVARSSAVARVKPGAEAHQE